jgi:hypothetical protein
LPTPFADDIKFAWKIQRDMAERGHSLANIKASIEARKPDFDAYIDPQKKKADVIIEVHTVGWMWVVFGARLCVSACLCVCRWRSGGRELSPCAAATEAALARLPRHLPAAVMARARPWLGVGSSTTGPAGGLGPPAPLRHRPPASSSTPLPPCTPLSQVLPTQLIPDEKEGKILRVRLIQKEGKKLFDPAYLFDEGSTVSWIPCGRKLTCNFPGEPEAPASNVGGRFRGEGGERTGPQQADVQLRPVEMASVAAAAAGFWRLWVGAVAGGSAPACQRLRAPRRP